LLLALVQDESKIMAILNDDGTVNDWKVDQLRYRLNLPIPEHRLNYDSNMYLNRPFNNIYNNDSNYQVRYSLPDYNSQESQFHRNPTQRPRTRWGTPVQDLANYNAQNLSSHIVDDRYNPSKSMWNDNSNQPSFFNQNTTKPSFRTAYGQNNSELTYRPPDDSLRSDVPVEDPLSIKKRKYGPKAGTMPCRFFGTAKGCQFGDNCAFSHNIEGRMNTPVSGLVGTAKKTRYGPSTTPPVINNRLIGIVKPPEGKDEFGRDIR
jgi:hypothetical protein